MIKRIEPTPSVIGFDPGFGNVKVCVDGEVATLQSAVARPRTLGLAAIGLRAARSIEVVFSGQRFMVGPGAWQRGEPLTSMDYAAIASDERLALFYGALAKAIPVASPDAAPTDYTLVIGLPVPLLQDIDQANAVLTTLKTLKRLHAFTVNGKSYAFTISRVRYIAQPVGTYMDWLYDAELKARPAGAKAKIAVLDIGMNTGDFYVLQNAQVQERHIGGAEVGVKRLLEQLAQPGEDLMELDADLRAGRLELTAAQLDSYLGEVLAEVKKAWPSLRRFSAVVPTGGGALVLGERLTLALVNRGATIHRPANAVESNALGLWKFGVLKAREIA